MGSSLVKKYVRPQPPVPVTSMRSFCETPPGEVSQRVESITDPSRVSSRGGRSQRYEKIPKSSLDREALSWMDCPPSTVVALASIAATGSSLTTTSTSWRVVSVWRPLSVTVKVTVKVPGALNSCWAVAPVAVAPSPKSHS